jgi:PPP family 3-phenylpropionic acid transporter
MNRKKVWIFAWHVLAFTVGPLWQFIVLYYQEQGFTGMQIGLLVGLTPLIMSFSAPLAAGLADATGRHRLVMGLGLLLGAAAISSVPLTHSFVTTALLVFMLVVCMAPTQVLGTSAAMHMLGDEKASYGRIRLGGTIGYAVSAITAGALVERLGLAPALWGGGAMLLLTLLVSQKLAYQRSEQGAPWRSGVRTLLRDVRWILFLGAAFAGGVVWIVVSGYMLPYMSALGAPQSVMGLAVTLGVVAEIPVFFYGDRLLRGFGAYGLLMLALVVSGARLLALGAANSVPLVLVLQFFGGLTFPAMWLAGTLYAEEHAPPGLSATAQGLFGAMINGFGAAAGGFAGGLLLERLGARGMFLALGVAALALTAAVALAWRRLHAARAAPSGTLEAGVGD